LAAGAAPGLVLAGRPEGISGTRPLTLLIATGIALVTAILMVTGIAANHLREQALRTAESELVRLARYPAAGSNPAGGEIDHAPVFADPAVTATRHTSAEDGRWVMQTARRTTDFPVAVVVSRDAGAVLAEWNHQILCVFALFVAAAVGIMVYLIARQFKTHADLAEMRTNRIEAEKIESERARLVAETELLKSERLSVLGQLTATVAHELRNR
jgi:hypothetical protein